ncbi:Protein transport protein Sec16B, partial [Nowakowskiella sp. JEL0078]
KPETPKTAYQGLVSLIPSIFGKKTELEAPKDESQNGTPKVYRANLGEENKFYYDKKLGKWVNGKPGAEEDKTPELPPPPMGGGPSTASLPTGIPESNSQSTSALDSPTPGTPRRTGPTSRRGARNRYVDVINPEGTTKSNDSIQRSFLPPVMIGDGYAASIMTPKIPDSGLQTDEYTATTQQAINALPPNSQPGPSVQQTLHSNTPPRTDTLTRITNVQQSPASVQQSSQPVKPHSPFQKSAQIPGNQIISPNLQSGNYQLGQVNQFGQNQLVSGGRSPYQQLDQHPQQDRQSVDGNSPYQQPGQLPQAKIGGNSPFQQPGQLPQQHRTSNVSPYQKPAQLPTQHRQSMVSNPTHSSQGQFQQQRTTDPRLATNYQQTSPYQNFQQPQLRRPTQQNIQPFQGQPPLYNA